jgi:GNAT superfamily N-acetyltransferase
MIVRLHNLSSRSPLRSDLDAIVELRAACDLTDFGCVQTVRENVEKAWQATNFNRLTDAWVVHTRRGQLIGYADVRRESASGAGVQLASSLYVHPDYRGRGIGTLLTWLTEERARELAHTFTGRVVLRHEVGTLTQSANRLLLREGYTLIHSFWRVSLDDGQACLMVDVPTASSASFNVSPVQNRTGLYVAHHYNVYEKDLCSISEPYIEASSMDDGVKEPLALCCE